TVHVWVKVIAGNFVDGDTRHVFLQGIADVQRPGLLDLIGVDDVDTRRHLLGIDTGARYGRGRVHDERRHGPGGASRILGTAAFNAWLGRGHHDGRQLLNGAGR